MLKNLVIVESPAKAKTIEKFLGKDYKVLSSYGHIRDLKKKDFGIDLAHNFTPQYEVPADKKKLVDTLKAEAKKAEMIWLASDEDREGESIAWHLHEVLGLNAENTKRIVFHEITQNAILHAIETPRTIDMDMVDAQQARRVLDRIVGFELSPVLWKKVKPALSAGRVQSVAVRLIVEREKEIEKFTAEAAYRVVAIFYLKDGKELTELKAELNKRFTTKAAAKNFLEKCKSAHFAIEDIQVKPAKKSPAPPFTTSTLQQEAARKLGFSVAQTMSVAQKLYEAGKITYMRTDSVNLSKLAIGTAKEEIITTLGALYHKSRNFTTKTKGAQEAHEAIRPTYMNQSVVEGTSQERRLYDLIWKRTLASQMSDAEIEKTTATISIDTTDEHFVASGEVLKFDGFLRIYMESQDDENENEGNEKMLPPLTINESLELKKIEATERFTQRPARYTEAALVRKLEELGIGRPSTYAPTISTVQQRGYVEKGDRAGTERSYTQLVLRKEEIKETLLSEITGADRSKLLPTDIGVVVTDYLVSQFPDILNYNFTAQVESKFDYIADGKTIWSNMIAEFYTLFHPEVEKALALRTEQKAGERLLGTDPKTGHPVSVKIGRFGPVVQIGLPDSDEKPQFASLLKEQSIATITLEEALKLFDLPRTLGDFEEKTVIIGIGKFGPYVRHDGKYVSLPKEYLPMKVTLEEAITIIEEKRQADIAKLIKSFDEEPDLHLINGRFGPYISYQKSNYKLPKGSDAASLTLDECKALIAEQDAKGTTSKKKKTAKAVTSKTATTKTTATKASKTKTTATKASKTKITATKAATAKATKESTAKTTKEKTATAKTTKAKTATAKTTKTK